MQDPSESTSFRRVLGHYPTGVCAVTAIHGGQPVGLIVGSFTSVSLDPPLVGFLPRRSSQSWQRIEAAKHFCINVLSEHQLDLCHALCGKDRDRFAGVVHRPSPAGAPMLEGALAWVDCTLEDVHEAGDHIIVIARVQALAAQGGDSPLLHFRGGYGRFTELDREAL